MADNTLKIKFAVDDSDLETGLANSQQRISDAAAALQKDLEGLGQSAAQTSLALKGLDDLSDDDPKKIQEKFAEETQQLQTLMTLHKVTADEAIAERKRIEEARDAAVRAELQAEALCVTEKEALHERLQAKEYAEETKHDARMRALDLQAVRESEKSWEQFLAPISHATDSAINGIIRGTLSLDKAMRNIGQSLVSEFTSVAVKRLTQWVASEAAMTEATVAGTTARGAAEQQGQGASIALHYGTAIKKIASAASETFAGVFAWASPDLGPFAAIPATAAAALVMAKQALIPSAAGGWDIPAGLNPLTQLHEREMVLPASIAEPLRSAVAGGGLGGDTHIHIHAIDARGASDWINRNGDKFAAAVRRQARLFNPAVRPA